MGVDEDTDQLSKDLNVLALFGLMDPLKEGVAEAIKKVSRAGLSVIMVTGDNLDTAKAIARKAGIIQKDLSNPGDASESSIAEISDPDLTARLSLYGKQNYECMTGM